MSTKHYMALLAAMEAILVLLFVFHLARLFIN